MKPIKTAIIGTGFIGPAHLEALQRIGGIQVVALASIEVEKAQALGERFSIPKIYHKWEDAVSDSNVEVIHNCTPNNLHFVINRAALKAGKHVISEKPLTMTSRESAELVSLAAKKGLVNAINFNYRFYPLIQHARAMMAKGELGKVYLVHGHYLQDWLYYDTDYNWRLETKLSGTSRAIADIGSHWCDLAQFVTGLKVTSVFADLMTVHPRRKRPKGAIETYKGKEISVSNDVEEITIRTEDTGIVMLRFENGAKGVVTVSQVSAGRKNCEVIEIDGSKAAVAWNQEEPNQLWVGHRERANEVIIKDPSLLHEEARKYAHYPGGHPEGYPDGPMNLFINVYDFIRSGKDPRTNVLDFPTFADGHWENRIVDAVLKSNVSCKWVEVKP